MPSIPALALLALIINADASAPAADWDDDDVDDDDDVVFFVVVAVVR